MNRRHLLQFLGASAGLALLPRAGQAMPQPKAKPSFVYCLNMATIRGHQLSFMKELETASKAGFRSVEIWMDSLQNYLKQGGTLAEARRQLNNLGIQVENAIGFASWVVDDEAQRQKGLDQLQREMEQLAQIGCKRIAAPPAGATNESGLDLKKAAERYRTILEMGDKTGVVPHLELWGFSKNLSRLSEVMYVALESGHPAARMLLDVYHLYKGGSNINTLPLISSESVEIFHMNDYAAGMLPASITDGDRVYPGDGVAPVQQILKTWQHSQRPLILSVEVFNKNYYSQDALLVAQTALKKLKAMTAVM